MSKKKNEYDNFTSYLTADDELYNDEEYISLLNDVISIHETGEVVNPEEENEYEDYYKYCYEADIYEKPSKKSRKGNNKKSTSENEEEEGLSLE